jgi:predicted RNA binding protein YcfA (HicA-like mRNA interferase family)
MLWLETQGFTCTKVRLSHVEWDGAQTKRAVVHVERKLTRPTIKDTSRAEPNASFQRYARNI